MFCTDIQSTEGHKIQRVLHGLGLYLTLNSNIEDNYIKENQPITFLYCTCLLLVTCCIMKEGLYGSHNKIKFSSVIFYHFNKQWLR